MTLSACPIAVRFLAAVLPAAALLSPAHASSTLPYGVRTHSFSGYSTTVFGDIRTVGMAGATLGLGDTFMAASENPAGLAMSLKEIDTHFAKSQVSDEHVQDPESPVVFTSAGGAASAYPWGFSLGYTSPYREEQVDSMTPGLPGTPAHLLVTTREFRAAAAHLFAHDRLSLGLELTLSEAAREIEFESRPDLNGTSKMLGYNVTVGALWRLKRRLLLGASFTPASRYEDDNLNTPSNGVAGFFQPIEIPARAGLGAGWIPNRFFRVATHLWIVGRTPRTALLKNDATLVGNDTTLQPRAGAAYVFMDFKELQGSIFGGSYLESSRIEGSSARFHATGGIEAKVWAVGVGYGFDASAGYRNILFSLGLDVVRLAEKLALIPKLQHAPYEGLLPNPFFESEEGLAHGLSDHWSEHSSENNPVQIIRGIPGRIEGIRNPFISLPEYLKNEVNDMKTIQNSRQAPTEAP